MSHTWHGRTIRAVMLFIFMVASQASSGFDPPADGLVYTCRAPDIRAFHAERTEVEGRGQGFTYHFSYVEAKGSLAPFERLQREFAMRQMARAAASAQSSFGPVGEKRMLGISFETSMRGDFAGLTAEVASITTIADRTHAGWLLHVPSGRLLTFDDLFTDPQATREMLVQKVRPMLTARSRGDYSGTARIAATDIDPRIIEVTNPAHSSAWHITLDHLDPCTPGLVLTFDGAWSMRSELPEIRLGSPSILSLMKPEFREALGAPIPLVGAKPPFASDIVARQLPDLVEISRQHLLPASELQPDLVGCPERSRDTLTVDMTAERSQWIYNGWYRWFFDLREAGVCVVLLYPEQRGLSRDEAWALLSAAKRRLPFDESLLDPAFAVQYPTDMAQTFGGMPTFKHGTTKSVDYTIGFMGIDAPLQPLDVIQRRIAREELATAARHNAHHHGASTSGPSHATLRMDFVSGGRTSELAVLLLHGSIAFADGTTIPIERTWMLHVPSGRLIGFDDLFVDAAVVRKSISDDYRKSIPSKMDSYTFIGEDREKQAADFRESYRRNAYRLSIPTRDHFRNLQFTGEYMSVYFSPNSFAQNAYAYGGASLEFLRKHLKPRYRRALDPAIASATRP